MSIRRKATHALACSLLVIIAISGAFSGCATPPKTVTPPVKIKEITPSRLPDGRHRLLVSLMINRSLVVSTLEFRTILYVYENYSSGRLRRVDQPKIKRRVLEFNLERCIVEIIYPPSSDSGYSNYGYTFGLYVARETWPAESTPDCLLSESRSEPSDLIKRFPMPARNNKPTQARDTKPPARTIEPRRQASQKAKPQQPGE